MLTERQSLCLSGLPPDGSFEERGSAYHSTYCALESLGLVKRRRQGTGFAWARAIETRTASADVLGVPTAFEIKTERTEDAVKITVSCVPPRMEYDRENNVLRVFPPRQF
jgi:hypothetical protein